MKIDYGLECDRRVHSIEINFAALVFHVRGGQEQGAVRILGPRRLENNSLLHMPTFSSHLQASSITKN